MEVTNGNVLTLKDVVKPNFVVSIASVLTQSIHNLISDGFALVAGGCVITRDAVARAVETGID